MREWPEAEGVAGGWRASGVYVAWLTSSGH
jgi:hypothetical protein